MTLPASHETLYPTRQRRRSGSSPDAIFPLLAARFSPPASRFSNAASKASAAPAFEIRSPTYREFILRYFNTIASLPASKAEAAVYSDRGSMCLLRAESA